jgi:hypothetical protein
MSRRQHITLLTIVGVFAFLAIFFVSIFRNEAEGTRQPDNLYNGPNGGLKIDDGILHGEATAPKLENATLKYVFLRKGLVESVLTCSKGRAWERSLEGAPHDDGEIP